MNKSISTAALLVLGIGQTIFITFSPISLNTRLTEWYVEIFQSPLPDQLPSAAMLFAYLVFFSILALMIAPAAIWVWSKLFPHLTKQGRFTHVMDSRKQLVDLFNNAMKVDSHNYQDAYIEFSKLRVQCLERMQKAKFGPENWGRMERLGSFDPVQGPNPQAAHIRSMCQKAISVILETIEDEKRNQ